MLRGFSLVEMLTAMALSLILIAFAMPLFTSLTRDQQFSAFAAELSANLAMARRHAQTAHTGVRLEFESDAQFRYRMFAADADGQWRPLLHSVWQDGYPQNIRCQLPAAVLPHPTRPRDIETPIVGLHAPDLHFGPTGSGGGTVVFSDGEERAVCAVVSPQSGEARLFLWRPGESRWRPFQ